MTALQWKRLYAQERTSLGDSGLHALLDAAEQLELSACQGVVFPHTRLEASGELSAAAALWALAQGFDRVLALGVLHGGRQSDAQLVTQARAGDASARQALRRVHGEGAPEDGGVWTEEFSLDNFFALLGAAARRKGVNAPQVIARYPFLVGDRPADVPGMEELERLRVDGVPVLATTDPIHHGAAYGTPPVQRRDRTDARTFEFATKAVAQQFALLEEQRYADFQAAAATFNSDFGDVGPALAHLLGGGVIFKLERLRLVDYSQALNAAVPTWVAAALASVRGKASGQGAS